MQYISFAFELKQKVNVYILLRNDYMKLRYQFFLFFFAFFETDGTGSTSAFRFRSLSNMGARCRSSSLTSALDALVADRVDRPSGVGTLAVGMGVTGA